MKRVLWSCVALGVCAAAPGAQSPPEMPWRQFRAPDSTFAVMYPSEQPPELGTRDSGYVTVDSYTGRAGTTSFVVRGLSHRTGASAAIRHLPSVDGFCATCLGRVVSDTTIGDARRAGRWILVEHESPDSSSKTTAVYRIVGRGAHIYVVSAESAPGKPLSPDSGWFLDSFRLCLGGDPCPAIVDGPPPWPVSPIRYLPPTTSFTEMFNGPPDLGQPFLDYQVDEPARPLPGSPAPIYPAARELRGIEGEVVATFVVDSSGSVEVPTFSVVRATDSLFVDAVKAALPAMRFTPATIGGRKVRQTVEESFPFKRPR